MTFAAPVSHLPVLAYHGIEDSDALSVTLSALTLQWEALVADGHRLTSLSEALVADEPCIALTFDDAYDDFIAVVPLLARLGASATLYAPSGHLGGHATWLKGAQSERRLLSPDQLAELDPALVEIGSHGRRHVPLDTATPDVLLTEVRESKVTLEGIVGRPIMSFAYPHGYSHGPSRRAVADAGYSSACVLGHRVHRRTDDPYAVSRLLVSRKDTAASVAQRVTKTAPTVRAVCTSMLMPAWRSARTLRQRAAT